MALPRDRFSVSKSCLSVLLAAMVAAWRSDLTCLEVISGELVKLSELC